MITIEHPCFFVSMFLSRFHILYYLPFPIFLFIETYSNGYLPFEVPVVWLYLILNIITQYLFQRSSYKVVYILETIFLLELSCISCIKRFALYMLFCFGVLRSPKLTDGGVSKLIYCLHSPPQFLLFSKCLLCFWWVYRG